MYPKYHICASFPVALVSLLSSQYFPLIKFELLNHEITIFVLCMAVGVLIDVDHILDFYINGSFGSGSLESKYNEGRMFVIFHGFENVIILFCLSIVYPFLTFPSISYFLHMVIDAYGNKVSYQAYFYIFRFRKILNKKNAQHQ